MPAVLFLALHLLAAAPADSGAVLPPVDTASAVAPAPAAPAPAPETCQELIRRVRASDCVRPVSRWLSGSSLLAGLTLSAGSLDITVNDDPLASMVAVVSPSPYFSLSSPARYIWGLPVGWETSVSYTASTAIYQDLRPGSGKVRDLGTYASTSFLSVSPSLFAGIGARDATPRIWARGGLGVGAGWASVRGSAFFTQDTVDPAYRPCYDAAGALLEGTGTKAHLREACDLQTYSEKGFGLSMRVFLDGRANFLYGSISAGGLILDTEDFEYFPMELAVRLAYVLDL